MFKHISIYFFAKFSLFFVLKILIKQYILLKFIYIFCLLRDTVIHRKSFLEMFNCTSHKNDLKSFCKSA